MRKAIATRATAAIIAMALPIAAMPAVQAAPVKNGVVKSQENTADKSANLDSATEEQQVEEVAKLLEKMDKAPSREEAQRVLEDNFSQEELNGVAEELDISSDEVLTGADAKDVGDAAATEEGFKDFYRCIKSKAGKDLRSALNVNAVMAAFGQKDYLKAAREIVKYLLKNGLKRNVFALAVTLGWYALQCSGKW